MKIINILLKNNKLQNKLENKNKIRNIKNINFNKSIYYLLIYKKIN